MSKNRLPDEWVARIFAKLSGIYGSQFSAKFSRVESGVDVGLLNSKHEWSEELGGFLGQPEAIAYALKNLPTDHPPNALQFAAICRRAPVKELPALPAPPVNVEKLKSFASELEAIINSGARGQDPIFLATHPKTELAFHYILGMAKNFPDTFLPCIEHLISTGRVSADGKKLLQRYAGNSQWVRA